ncbi:MAG: MarR family transcriptional regulator [Bacteroidales bacterium]|nr:MarR family transcriptional regulator [Bacteroidales bacterium]
MDSNQKIISALRNAGRPMRPGEIAEAAGLDKKDVEKAIKAMVAEGKIHSPKRCFYDLKS